MEKEKMKTLIIKEVKEFFCNYKSWLNIIVISGVFYLFGDKELPINHFYEWFALMAPLQYVYDSFIMDTKSKGMVFLYNTKNRYLSIFVIKNFISLILLIITFIISFPYFQKYIQMHDFLWIIPTLFFGVSLMQIAAIFSKGAEITREIMNRLKFNKKTIQKVTKLIEYHDYEVPENEMKAKNFLSGRIRISLYVPLLVVVKLTTLI